MHRLTVTIASVALGLALVSGVSAQEAPPTLATTANGGVSNADPGNPIVVSQGENQVYGPIETGGTGGEIVGDPNALAGIPTVAEIASSVPPVNPTSGGSTSDGVLPAPPADSSTAATGTSDGAAPAEGAPAEGAPAEGAPVDGTTTGTAPDGTAAAPATDTTSAAPATGCDYSVWYDAQLAYEAAGGLNGDPAVVQAMDPDYDGIACEYLIVY